MRTRRGRCYSRFFFFSSRRRHTRCSRDWSSDVCSSDLGLDLREDPSSFEHEEGQADDGYQEDVGILVVLQREADERIQRRPKDRERRREKKGEADIL